MRPSPPAASPATSAVGGEALPGLPGSLASAGSGRQYALRFSCGHYVSGTYGVPLSDLPKAWKVKEILTPCRQCQPKVRRLDPALSQRVAEEEWV